MREDRSTGFRSHWILLFTHLFGISEQIFSCKVPIKTAVSEKGDYCYYEFLTACGIQILWLGHELVLRYRFQLEGMGH